MPPTPEQLQIDINQNLVPQATQLAPSIIDPSNTAAVTPEGEVSMPAPQQWIGAIDYGMNWNLLGAKAFDVAGAVYERVLDYNIQKKGAEVADAIYDSETQVYDSFNATKLDETGKTVPNDIDSVTKFYEDKQTKLRTKINEIVGNDIFDPNFSFDGYGSKWFPLIDGARKGYEELAKAGERVQRDSLKTFKETQDTFDALKKVKDGMQVTSKQAQIVDDIIIQERQKIVGQTSWTIPASKENIDLFGNVKGTTIDGENGTLTISSEFSQLPQLEQNRQIQTYLDTFQPTHGQTISKSLSNGIHELATSDLSTMNRNELAVNMGVLSALSPSQFNAMVLSGQDLPAQSKNKLVLIKTLGVSGMSPNEIVKFVKSTPPDVSEKVANMMSYMTAQNPSLNLPYSSDAKSLESTIFTGINPDFKLTNDHTNIQAMSDRYTSVRDYVTTVAYVSNLPIEQKQKDKTLAVLKEQFNANHMTVTDNGIDTLVDIRNLPILSTPFSGPLQRSIRESGAAIDKNGDMKTADKSLLYFKSQLATITWSGNTGALLDNRKASIDRAYGMTHSTTSNRLENTLDAEFIKIRSLKTDPVTGKQLTGGVTDSLMLQHVFASSDQALSYYNGGKTPVTKETILAAYNKGMTSIGPAHSWEWSIDTTTDSEINRIKQDGSSSVPMRIKSIPVFMDMNDKIGTNNLLGISTIVPYDLQSSLVKNKGGQPAFALESNKNTSNMIDLTSQQEDLNTYVSAINNKTQPMKFRIGDIDQFNIDHYVEEAKTQEEIINEVSTNLVREVRNTNLDAALLGSDPKLNSKEKFKMAIYKDEPFLVHNTVVRLGISTEQASNIVHDLITSDTYLDTIYDRNNQDTYIHAMADTTITIAKFVRNGETLPAYKIPEATTPIAPTLSNQPILKPETQSNTSNFGSPSEGFGKPSNDFGKSSNDFGKPVSPGAVRGSSIGNFISEYEGLKTTAYYDETGKVWTIGKGTTKYEDGTPVKQGDKITKEKANQLMESYIENKVIPTLEKTIPTWGELDRNQRDALVSFAYNVGPNFYGKKGYETITKELSSVDTLERVSAALKLYNKSDGKVLNGLIKRRKAEGDLWNSVVR